MTSMSRVFIIPKNLGFFFVILVPFELLSHYPNINGSYWLREDFQGIIVKVVRETRVVLMASTFSSRTFLLNFWFLHAFVVVFIIIRLILLSC